MVTKRVLVTGATSGIGREAAFQMATQGASLILAVRDIAKGDAVAAEIARTTGRDSEQRGLPSPPASQVPLCNLGGVLSSTRRWPSSEASPRPILNMACHRSGS